MLNLEEQRQFIKDAGYIMADSATGEIYHSDFDVIADNWSLSDKLKRFVGEEGVVSFPMEFENKIILDDSRNLSRAISSVQSALHDFLNAYQREIEAIVEEVNAGKDFETLLVKTFRNIRAYGIEVSYKQNKVIIKSEGTLRNGLGEDFPFSPRKSAIKTAEKLCMDLYTKEVYQIVSKTYWFQEKWDRFLSNLRDLENIVSKNIKSSGRLYLSALPEDLLTSSINDYNWTSCFAADGCNAHMPFEHMRNENTMIAYYIPDSARNRTFEYAGKEVANKPWRMYVHLTHLGNLALAKQQYPTSSHDLAMSVGRILQNAFGGELYENEEISRSGEQYFEETGVYINFNEEYGNKEVKRLATYDYIEDDLTVCTITGDYIGDQSSNNDELITFRSYDELDLFYCESCGRYHGNDDHDMNIVKATWGDYRICDYCAEDYSRCHFTGNLIHTDYDDFMVVITENSKVVIADQDYASDELDGNGYTKLKILYRGIRWDDAFEYHLDFLISDKVEKITTRLMYELSTEVSYPRDVQVFIVLDENEELWGEMYNIERSPNLGIQFAFTIEGFKEYELDLIKI